jgi:hypothetical protein
MSGTRALPESEMPRPSRSDPGGTVRHPMGPQAPVAPNPGASNPDPGTPRPNTSPLPRNPDDYIRGR